MQHRFRSHESAGRSPKKLLEAAVLAAKGKGNPPPELELAWLCGDYHLPESGGVFDQDYQLFRTMRILNNVHSAVTHLFSLSGEDINKRLSTGERLLLGNLDKMGLLGGLDG